MTVEEIIARAIKDIPTTILEVYERPGGPPGNGWRPAKAIEEATMLIAALDAAGYIIVPKEPSDELLDDEVLAEAVRDELKRQQAFSIVQYGKIALSEAPFVLAVYRALIEARPR